MKWNHAKQVHLADKLAVWAIPAETTILPSTNETGPGQILFLQILFFLHDNGQVYLS